MKFLTESAVWDILENTPIQYSLKVLSDVSEKAFSLLYMD